MPVYLQTLSLMLVAGIKDRLSSGRALLIGLCALGLPLCGMQGVVTGSIMAIWLIYAGWRAVRFDTNRLYMMGGG